MASVGFTIEGPWLSDFARTRVIEGRWDHAIRTLDCLEGITMDQTLAILRGDAKLTGCSNTGVGFEPDDDKKHKAALSRQYAGTYIDTRGRYLRPYAVVTSWGPEDMAAREKITPGSDSVGRTTGTFGSMVGQYAGSSLFYADDPDHDVLRLVRLNSPDLDIPRNRQGQSHVLFKQVDNYPCLLFPPHTTEDADAAVKAYLEAGLTLRRVGYNHTFPPDFYRVRDEVEDPTKHRAEGPFTCANSDPEMDRNARSIALARVDRLEAEKNGVSIEEWQAYQDRMQDKAPVVERTTTMLDILNKAHEVQDDFSKNHARYVTDIIKQTNGNWLSLGEINGEEINVPRAPFENWCLWRGDGAHLAMPWDPVCPSGLKMFGDDPYHTDFLLGAGLGLDAMNDDAINDAVYEARHKVQSEKLGFDVAVLCGTGKSGNLQVVHPKRGESCQANQVAVIPNAGPNYVAAASTAGAIICAQGGAMAHLVTVSREKDVKIVRVPDAMKLYPPGMTLVVDCQKGRVEVPFNRVDYKMLIAGQVIDVDKLGEDHG